MQSTLHMQRTLQGENHNLQAAHVHIARLGRNSLVTLMQLKERGQQVHSQKGMVGC